jgi:hypothetical protein
VRLMSFALTTEQFRRRQKFQTRRLGWRDLKPGAMLRGVVKAQGLAKGTHPEDLGLIRVTAVRREPLNAITQDDVIKEGFPDLTPLEFVRMFIEHQRVNPTEVVTVIDFEYVDAEVMAS